MKAPATHEVFRVHGPQQTQTSLVLDSPHSGNRLPPDFGSVCSWEALRSGEDCFIDELYMPSTAIGVPLLTATFPRTYLDPNRHPDDLDLSLMAEPWPGPTLSSGKGALGKALLWRTLPDGRPIYDRKLSVAEVQHRILHYHRPYHQALQSLLDAAHARFGVVHHINCHSMNSVSGAMDAGGPGQPRADFVLGDRDGTTCAPEFTAFVREHLLGLGYSVKVNDPYKGVELVRAYANPAQGRHSLQIEIAKRVYMHNDRIEKNEGFDRLQAQMLQMIQALQQQFQPR